MEKFTKILANLLRPLLAPVSRWLLAPERRRPTWHYEAFFVGSILLIVAAITSPYPGSSIEWASKWRILCVTWISAFAVFGSFLHAKVGYRMSEAMRATKAPSVSCYEWSDRYWLTKEILWFFVFLLSGAYPAIFGNIIFIVYPAWRKIHLEERVKMRGEFAS